MKMMAGAILVPQIQVDKPDTGGIRGEAHLSLHPGLAHDVGAVVFHRLSADTEDIGHLLVGVSIGKDLDVLLFREQGLGPFPEDPAIVCCNNGYLVFHGVNLAPVLQEW
jgi:hypothetical protein